MGEVIRLRITIAGYDAAQFVPPLGHGGIGLGCYPTPLSRSRSLCTYYHTEQGYFVVGYAGRMFRGEVRSIMGMDRWVSTERHSVDGRVRVDMNGLVSYGGRAKSDTERLP